MAIPDTWPLHSHFASYAYGQLHKCLVKISTPKLKNLSTALSLNYNKLYCNHSNYHLVIMHWHIFMSTLSCHFYEGRMTKMHPYGVNINYLHVSPNSHYILLSISKSHGSPKTNFTALMQLHVCVCVVLCVWVLQYVRLSLMTEWDIIIYQLVRICIVILCNKSARIVASVENFIH